MHVVESVFANDASILHTSNHDERENALKTTRKYEHIYRNYSPLKRASINARYLAQTKAFDAYLTPAQVVDELLKHGLHQIEESAVKFLKAPDKLMRIRSAFS